MKFINSSIGKKVIMAISAIFLMVFLLQHFIINFTSIISENIFNSLSHFMGTNPMVQYIFQPILILGVLIHFFMGFYLEFQNRSARGLAYNKNVTYYNSSWVSRNMIWSGLVIFFFLILHFIDFWIPEMNYKYIEQLAENPNRYYAELNHKFKNPLRVTLYCISFIFLSLHLLHGFTSSLKSLSLNKVYTDSLKPIGYIFFLGIPFGFCFIAIFHYYSH